MPTSPTSERLSEGRSGKPSVQLGPFQSGRSSGRGRVLYAPSTAPSDTSGNTEREFRPFSDHTAPRHGFTMPSSLACAQSVHWPVRYLSLLEARCGSFQEVRLRNPSPLLGAGAAFSHPRLNSRARSPIPRHFQLVTNKIWRIKKHQKMLQAFLSTLGGHRRKVGNR